MTCCYELCGELWGVSIPFALSLSKGSEIKKSECFDRLSTNGIEGSYLITPPSTFWLPFKPNANFST